MNRETFRQFCEEQDVALAVLSRDRADVLARRTDKIAADYHLFYSGDGYDEREYRCSARTEVPRGLEGRPVVANYVLRQLDAKTVFLMDDDVMSIVWLGEDRLQHVDSDGFLAMLVNLTVNARDVGAGLCGISEVDIRKTSPLAPFHTRAMVAGLVGVTGRGIWFDERNKIKADYDFVLQHLKRDRLVWKDLRYFLSQDRNNLPGGAMAFRTREREDAEVENLKRWWGEDMIRWTEGKGTRRLRINV